MKSPKYGLKKINGKKMLSELTEMGYGNTNSIKVRKQMEIQAIFLREYIDEEITKQYFENESRANFQRFTPHPSSMSKNASDKINLEEGEDLIEYRLL